MNQATFIFYNSLNFFLPRHHKNIPIRHEFDWKASIKDMTESLGIPHPEIELLVVNGNSVDFTYIVQPGDHIEGYAHPEAEAVDIHPRIELIPPYPGRLRFVLDTHLGRLANYLRMMGFDTLYRNDYPDDELADVSHHEQRILLTRDVGLLKRSLVIYGYYVRNTNARLRIHEVVRRYNLIDQIIPFRHCLKCNGLLQPVDKDLILDQLSPNTKQYYDRFHQCQTCEQIYWKGSHYEKMEQLLEEVRNEQA